MQIEPQEHRLSMANEDYLEAIYRLMVERWGDSAAADAGAGAAAGAGADAGAEAASAALSDEKNPDAEPAETIRSVEIAELMGVSKASVNKALATLKERGFVEQNRYGRVALTPEGHDYAAFLWHCHCTLRRFLIDDLGVDAVTADDEACRMEHALSPDTMRRWVTFLENESQALDAGAQGDA